MVLKAISARFYNQNLNYFNQNLINNTSFNTVKNENTSMFDTSRFTDVTTNRQQHIGVTVYIDNENPGVSYSSYASGYVRRSVRTNVKELTLNRTNLYCNEQTYQINPRENSNSTIIINQGG